MAVLGPDDLVFCSATLFDATLEEKIRCCAAGGFRGLSVWPFEVAAARARGNDAATLRRMLDDHGVVIAGIDCLLDWIEGDAVPEEPSFRATVADMLTVAEVLGGSWINVGQAFGTDFDLAATGERFARICERAAAQGIAVTLEPIAWGGIKRIATAVELMRTAGRPANARLAVDCWHFFRGGNGLADLAGLPAGLFDNTQLNDGPLAMPVDLWADTVNRRVPGEGEFPLASLIADFRARGVQTPWGIECPSPEWNGRTPEEVGKRCGDAMRRTLAI